MHKGFVPLHSTNMLFSRLFNWVRYKTLPPSTLFLNRLFIERDSKHRRVTSNLGLTFRNSKWSSYARTNIQSSDRHSYLTEIFLTIAALLLLILLGFVPFNDLLTWVASFLTPAMWFLTDVDLYLKAIFSSASLCLLQVALNDAIKRFFGFSMQTSDQLQQPISQSKFSECVARLHKPLLYTHLTRSNPSEVVDSLYDSNLAPTTQLIKSLHLTQHLTSLLQFSQNARPSVNSSTYIASTRSLTKPDLQVLALEAQLFPQSTLKLRTEWVEDWTLRLVHLKAQSELAPFPAGLVYVPTTDLNNLNKTVQISPELAAIRQSVNNHLALIRWNRWLYKFSVIHRNSFKMVHKYTDVKKLLGVGFYDRDLFTQNMWASASFSSEFQPDQKTASISDFNKFNKVGPALFRQIYGDYSAQNQWALRELSRTGRYLQTPSLSALRFYETGYYWWIQRSSLTMSTLNDAIVAAPTPFTKQVTNQQQTSTGTMPFLRSELSQTLQSPFHTNLISHTPLLASKSKSADDLYLSYIAPEFLTSSVTGDITSILRNTAHPVFMFYSPRRLS